MTGTGSAGCQARGQGPWSSTTASPPTPFLSYFISRVWLRLPQPPGFAAISGATAVTVVTWQRRLATDSTDLSRSRPRVGFSCRSSWAVTTSRRSWPSQIAPGTSRHKLPDPTSQAAGRLVSVLTPPANNSISQGSDFYPALTQVRPWCAPQARFSAAVDQSHSFPGLALDPKRSCPSVPERLGFFSALESDAPQAPCCPPLTPVPSRRLDFITCRSQ